MPAPTPLAWEKRSPTVRNRRFHGRVVCLFVTLLLMALTELFGELDYLRYRKGRV